MHSSAAIPGRFYLPLEESTSIEKAYNLFAAGEQCEVNFETRTQHNCSTGDTRLARRGAVRRIRRCRDRSRRQQMICHDWCAKK